MQLMIVYGLLGRLWLVYLANIYIAYSATHSAPIGASMFYKFIDWIYLRSTRTATRQ